MLNQAVLEASYVELSQTSLATTLYAGNKGDVVPVWNGSLDCSFVLP